MTDTKALIAEARAEANKTITALLKVRDAAIIVIDAHLLEVEDPWGLLDEAIAATL